MQKVIFILIFYVILAACSSARKVTRSARSEPVSVKDNLIATVMNQNLTGKGFFIEKAEFRIRDRGKEKSGIGTIKFLTPDKFLISVKSNAGIELVRIFITGDSIKINDRFDKKLFYGSAGFLKSKYGLTTAVLPVLLGDYINEENKNQEDIKCTKGSASVNGRVGNIRIRYNIDCNYGKTAGVVTETFSNEQVVKIEYGDFFLANEIYAPGEIEISDNMNNTSIEIKIIKITSPWEGTIEFLPGKQYERILLQ